ncbi:MAG: hypothetical protein SPI30_05380 [Prevotella sp.]|nr:hypothetical protein [Prevotella sp.]
MHICKSYILHHHKAFSEYGTAGLVIVPQSGTHATKHRYEPYQPLVHAVPTIGINSTQISH